MTSCVLYRIADWQEHFENNRTKDMKVMRWVPVPNKLDGDGYTELIDHPNGPAHYGAWMVIVCIASKCGFPAGNSQVRGTLMRSTGEPHCSTSLSRISRIPKEVFDEVLPRLVSIGWLSSEPYEVTGDTEPEKKQHLPAEKPQEPARKGREGNRREGKGIEGKEENNSLSVQRDETGFLELWNDTSGVVRNRGSTLNANRRKSFRARIRDPAWDWKAALAKFPLKCFEEDPDGWRPDLDWFLKSDSVQKILEGKYDWTKSDGRPTARKLTPGEDYDPNHKAKL